MNEITEKTATAGRPQGGDVPDAARRTLDRLYDQVTRGILARQHPVTGLLPASTAVTVHGNYTHAWVRDNVYSVLAPWALALAYRRRGDAAARARLLEQSVLKTMRGLLQAMMKQAAKVERFKQTQAPLDSLHAIYSAATGEAVAPDDGWGHLQVDATSLFLLFLAQMTRSGLPVLFTMDEVAFVQNLVHYIGPAYRIADYGIWERGRKINDGAPELNASSIGMAKAALEAIQGLDMFGEDGGRIAVIQVVPDEVARARATLEALLPRESGSKEVDAALLGVVGFPAFAVEDPELIRRTMAEVLGKLQGPYGCKRFLRDGHQTAIEDHSRLHYEAGELHRFEGIESEWPLFFTYVYLSALLTGDTETAANYRKRLDALAVNRDGEPMLPELYYVPAELAEAERAAPGSQPRLPNENVPLLWAQSLFVVGQLIEDGLLSPADIDPLGRRLRPGLRPAVPAGLVLLAEDEAVRLALKAQGVEAETLSPNLAARVCHADLLNQVLGQVGACPGLGLTGRPKRRLGSLITCQAFRLSGQPTVFVPTFFDPDDFYFSFDNRLLVERLTAEIAYINHSWLYPESPLLVLLVTRGMAAAAEFGALARMLQDLTLGRVPELAVQAVTLGRGLSGARTVVLDGVPAGEAIAPRPAPDLDGAAPVERPAPPSFEEMADWRAETSDRVAERLAGEADPLRRLELISVLWERHGPDHPAGEGLCLRALAGRLYEQAGLLGHWAVVRRAAGLLDRHDERLQDAVKEIVVRQRQVLLGRPTAPEALVQNPVDNRAVIERVRRFASAEPTIASLVEEALLFCGTIIKASPALFRHSLTLRPLDMVGVLHRMVQRERGLDPEAALDRLLAESPHHILTRIRIAIAACPGTAGDSCLPVLVGAPVLINPTGAAPAAIFALPEAESGWAVAGDWTVWRDVTGVLTPVPADFYSRVWEVLRHCDGIVIADPADPANQLRSSVLRSDMTPGERNFALMVEGLLNRIAEPSYRQLSIEALWAVSELVRAEPALRIAGTLALDPLIAEAVRLHWRTLRGEGAEAEGPEPWRAFYALSPDRAATLLATAFRATAGVGLVAAA
ncbi:MAG TPA: glycoside hydrolase family 15 protein [Azospirillaceae bacterium]|nr:glycoside hydrolase family 15 protein [Azospirillaceae bacterium]